MESIYRRWVKDRKPRPSDHTADGDDAAAAELRTALGTAKWQVQSLPPYLHDPWEEDPEIYCSSWFLSAGGDRAGVQGEGRGAPLGGGGHDLPHRVRVRHQGTGGGRRVVAGGVGGGGRKAGPLLGPLGRGQAGRARRLPLWLPAGGGGKKVQAPPIDEELPAKKAPFGERVQAHRRTASASSDVASWTISLAIEDANPMGPSDDQSRPGMPKVFSMSRLSGLVEAAPKKKFFKKAKHAADRLLHDLETIPLQDPQASNGFGFSYGRSKSCIDNSSDESCRRRLQGWIGSLQRQLQRSQYQIQYGRSVQVIFWVVAALLLIVLFVLRAI